MKFQYPVEQQIKFFHLQAEIDSLLYELLFSQNEDSTSSSSRLSFCLIERKNTEIGIEIGELRQYAHA